MGFVWNYSECVVFLTIYEINTKMVSFYETMEIDAKNAIVVKVTTISHEMKRVSSCKCTIPLRIGIVKIGFIQGDTAKKCRLFRL